MVSVSLLDKVDYRELRAQVRRLAETGEGINLHRPIEERGLAKTEEMQEAILEVIQTPLADRLWYVMDGLRVGATIEQICESTAMDPWFVTQLAQLIEEERSLDGESRSSARGRRASSRQGARLHRQAHRPPSRRDTRAGAGGARSARRPSHLRARRHVCGGVRRADALPLLDVGARHGVDAHRAQEGDDPGRRAEPHRSGHRVRLLLRARVGSRSRSSGSRPSWSTAIPRR